MSSLTSGPARDLSAPVGRCSCTHWTWRCDFIGAWLEAPSLSCPRCPAGACRPAPVTNDRTTMPPITPEDAAIIEVTGGVDTHQDTHTAAVIDPVGRVLGTEQFPTTPAGYAALLAWMRGYGRVRRVGVEGT